MIVGTFMPEIEIWNLDSENCDPIAVLGDLNASEESKKLIKNFKKGSTPAAAHPENTHTDAVMSISLNPFQREYLLSGSADQTVRVWDLDELVCKATYSDLHTDKVQAVRWNRVNE
jgi:periodic tryptophan protein 1